MAKVRARPIYSSEELSVTAMELLEFRTDRANSRRFVTGSLKPIAVIVRTPDRTYAIDMAGQPVGIHRAAAT
jgi:hypothetical protein